VARWPLPCFEGGSHGEGFLSRSRRTAGRAPLSAAAGSPAGDGRYPTPAACEAPAYVLSMLRTVCTTKSPGAPHRGPGTGIHAMAPLPVALQEAIERGELTPEQLRQLITLEAEELGLTFDEAVKLARERRLPKTALGADLELLVQLLPA